MATPLLPNEAWVNVASYLPSQALLALALTPSSSWSEDVGDGQLLSSPSKAIISALVCHHGGLDFVNVEKADHLASLTEKRLRVMLTFMGVKGCGPTVNFLPIVLRAAELLLSAETDGNTQGPDGCPQDAVPNVASAVSLKNGTLALDFGSIEKNCCLNRFAAALTDDDVTAILYCINARHCLARLRLDGCVSVTGYGLEPLRGSTSLAQIDLGIKSTRLPDPTNPQRTDERHPILYYPIVLSIFESILSTSGNVLQHVYLSDSRIAYRGMMDNPDISAFIAKYNQMLEACPLKCANCDIALGATNLGVTEDGKQTDLHVPAIFLSSPCVPSETMH